MPSFCRVSLFNVQSLDADLHKAFHFFCNFFTETLKCHNMTFRAVIFELTEFQQGPIEKKEAS